NNRMILRLLLEDYMDENDSVEFSLDEAEDGKIAVDKCKNSSFDIILMDIMMPNMDGIEATKIIRQEDKKIMIIAVSAVDDSERKKLILSNGAEDYIAKPINSDIFISRMINYLTLVETRKTKHFASPHAINHFTSEVFSRHMRFMINSEDALSEFWEYFLLSKDIKCDDLSDVIRTVFAIADIQRKLQIESDIYVEESEDKRYFTLTKLDNLPLKIVELTLRKNNYIGKYKMSNGRISFELDVVFSDIKVIDIPEISEDEMVSEVEFLSSTELSVFNYIDSDDLYDLEEYASKLNSIMLIVAGGEVTEDEVSEIYGYLEKLGSILSTYSEVYVISQALSSLSVDMSSHMQEFMDNAEALGPMCKAFSNDMTNWINQSFHSGAPSIDFMNDTIVVNCQTISGMLKMDEAPAGGDEDFDDIFDF
ncbi:MAG: response regulator, partial [Sulfurimonas sp.]|nr:response regulator [Sulfurimonas sp.]